MAYETIRTEPAARGLVNYKVKVNDDRAVWIKTEPDTPQSDLDVLVDEFLFSETAEIEKQDKLRSEILELINTVDDKDRFVQVEFDIINREYLMRKLDEPVGIRTI